MLVNSRTKQSIFGSMFDAAQNFILHSQYEFALTGSRRHPNFTNEHSDYDYYVIDNPSVVQYLKKLGFELVEKDKSYNLQSELHQFPVYAIYRLQDGADQIDVQLCSQQGFLEKNIIHRIFDISSHVLSELYSLPKPERKAYLTKLHEAIRGNPIGFDETSRHSRLQNPHLY